MFTLDGITWPVPCKIERAAEVRPSQISGLLLDRSYFNDVIGTYMRYTVSLAVPPHLHDTYSQIYEALTDPCDGHQFLLPYDQGHIAVTGRVEQVADQLVRLPDGGLLWKGVRFTVSANHPSKQLSLAQVLARGRSPLPDLAAVRLGDIYTYTATGWTLTNYADADGTEY